MLAVEALVVARRSRRRRHAAVAQSGRDSQDPVGAGRCVPLGFDAAVAGRSTSIACSPRSRRTRALAHDQLAQQSDRLDARRARSSRRFSIIAAGTASGSSPTTSTSVSTMATPTRVRAVVPRPRRCRTSALVSTNSFSKIVADDRLAAGLDRRAVGADAGSRQADRIQHVVLAGRSCSAPASSRSSTASRRSRTRSRAFAVPAIS